MAFYVNYLVSKYHAIGQIATPEKGHRGIYPSSVWRVY